MFAGTYRNRTDAKGRLAIPAALRKHLPPESYISIGPEMVLTIYPPEGWTQMLQRLPAPMGASPEERALSRALYASAVPCEFDAQGRVSLSQEQRRLTGIEPNSTVVVIGNGAVVEIWAEERWDSYFGDAQSHFTEFADRVIKAPERP
jgi:MraZ protein